MTGGPAAAGLPRRVSSRRASRGSPASSRICHTVCAEIGVPAAASDCGDLADAAVLGPQRQHPVADLAGGFARSFRARLGLGEGVELAGAQQGGHLMHRGGGVAEPVGHLGGGGLVDEVGAQRLVAALPRTAGRGEVLRPWPQLDSRSSMHLW